MSQRTISQNEKRLKRRILAEESEWQRRYKNKDYIADIDNIRQEFNIPFFKDLIEQNKWRDSQPTKTVEAIRNKLDNINIKYGIKPKSDPDLWGEFTTYPDWVNPIFSGETFSPLYSVHGQAKGLMITTETDLDNPLVIKKLKEWQREQLSKGDKPPDPIKIKGSNKLDWKPVWEWALRHQWVTRKEIAHLLGRDYTDVKRKLEELDKQT